ncbi:hypothetical protein D3C72_494190 [compost metagenome]
MNRKFRLTLLALGGTLAVAGCGTAGLAPASVKGAAAPATKSTERFFPANPDAVWQYEVTAHPADDPDVDYKGTETVTVDSIRRNGAETVLKLRAIDEFTQRYRFPVVTEGPNGVTIQNVDYWGAAAAEVQGLTIQFLQFPLTTGARWDDGAWIGKALRKETVKVPAGSFEAWNIDVIGTHDQRYTAVGHYWVAPGKGIVKSELSIPGWNIESVMIPAGKAKKQAPGARPLPKLGR